MTMLRTEDLMTTGVIALNDTETVERAYTAMETANIRHIPVVDAKERVVGIVSNRDLLRAMATAKGKAKRIGELMTRDVRTIHPHTAAHQAAEVMLDKKIGSLPVVNDQEVLVGIITETDFLMVAREALEQRFEHRRASG
jgi:CBS domain-containing protein